MVSVVAAVEAPVAAMLPTPDLESLAAVTAALRQPEATQPQTQAAAAVVVAPEVEHASLVVMVVPVTCV